MNEYKLSYGEGLAQVSVNARFVGKDLEVLLTAGKAHIGAVALAVPCTPIAEGVTASCSVLTAPGHRDNIPAESAALKLCKALSCSVSVAAGLHIDKASQEEIMLLVENSNKVIEALIINLRG